MTKFVRSSSQSSDESARGAAQESAHGSPVRLAFYTFPSSPCLENHKLLNERERRKGRTIVQDQYRKVSVCVCLCARSPPPLPSSLCLSRVRTPLISPGRSLELELERGWAAHCRASRLLTFHYARAHTHTSNELANALALALAQVLAQQAKRALRAYADD